MTSRTSRIVGVIGLFCTLALGHAPNAVAAPGWSYQLIWDVPSAGPAGTTGNVCSFAINASDQVAYVRRTGSVIEVVLWENGSNHVIYSPSTASDPVPKCTTGTGDEATVGLRADGLVTFTVSLPASPTCPPSPTRASASGSSV